MGGGGGWYDRDTSDYDYDKKSKTYKKEKDSKTSKGFSKEAEQKFSSRASADSSTFPKDRVIICDGENLLIIIFDDTGSMRSFPKIFWDKMPMIAGQIGEKKYLEDPLIGIAAVGDIFSDSAPLQICDLSQAKGLDIQLQRLWLEGNGGSFDTESYELMAYFYASDRFDISKAKNAVVIFIGDERFYDDIKEKDLKEHFGGQHQGVSSKEIFGKLKEKFKDNVFLVHREYGGNDERVVKQWQGVLSKEKVVILPEDLAIGDIILGILALLKGITLDEYAKDMKEREQTASRIEKVTKALKLFAGSVNPFKIEKDDNKDKGNDTSATNSGIKKRNKKPGRI